MYLEIEVAVVVPSAEVAFTLVFNDGFKVTHTGTSQKLRRGPELKIELIV